MLMVWIAEKKVKDVTIILKEVDYEETKKKQMVELCTYGY